LIRVAITTAIVAVIVAVVVAVVVAGVSVGGIDGRVGVDCRTSVGGGGGRGGGSGGHDVVLEVRLRGYPTHIDIIGVVYCDALHQNLPLLLMMVLLQF
jgi:hypothetical protein